MPAIKVMALIREDRDFSSASAFTHGMTLVNSFNPPHLQNKGLDNF
jgi:hypothetical protein